MQEEKEDGEGESDDELKPLPAPSLLVADSAEAFVDAVNALYSSPPLWSAVAEQGFAGLQQHASVDAVVAGAASLLGVLMTATPTTMASAAAAHTHQSKGGGGGGVRGGGAGFSSFTRSVSFGRRALAMEKCSGDHTADLLTFAPPV
jgi:hypothetical protein